MSIGKRVARIFGSRRFRADDTEALKDRLDQTYRTQTTLLQQVRRGVADMATSRRRVELQLATLAQQAAQLDDEARQAVSRGDDEGARGLLTRKVTLDKTAEGLKAQHADLQVQEDKLQASAQSIEQEVEDFRIRKDTLTARHAAAEARAEISSATSGIGSAVSDVGQAMEAAERRTRELEATADAADELVAEGLARKPGETADAALSRQFDAALDTAEVDRQLDAISAPTKEDGHGTDPIQR